MTRVAHGTVRGKTIELREDLGMTEGQEVELTVNPVSTTGNWGEGLRRCAGVLATEWPEEDDRILSEIHDDRKRDTRQDLAE